MSLRVSRLIDSRDLTWLAGGLSLFSKRERLNKSDQQPVLCFQCPPHVTSTGSIIPPPEEEGLVMALLPQYRNALIAIWILFGAATIFLGLRIYCKISKRKRLLRDDWILIASWISRSPPHLTLKCSLQTGKILTLSALACAFQGLPAPQRHPQHPQ